MAARVSFPMGRARRPAVATELTVTLDHVTVVGGRNVAHDREPQARSGAGCGPVVLSRQHPVATLLGQPYPVIAFTVDAL